MQYTFGSGSVVETTALSWNMWYPLPFPPHNTQYNDEFGLHVHLEPTDASSVASAFADAATALADMTGFGEAFTGLANIAAQALIAFVENADGSLDVWFSTHGFQVGTAEAFDPTVLLPGAWAAVMSALQMIAGETDGVHAVTLTVAQAQQQAAIQLPGGSGPASKLVSATPVGGVEQ
jgi:hypothetical protein